MIVLHTFRETHEQYQQGRIPFCVLQNLAKVMLDIEPMPNRYVFEATDISDVDIHWLLDTAVADEDYNGMLNEAAIAEKRPSAS